MAIDVNHMIPILMDMPEGDVKTGETVAIGDKGWIIQSTDKDQDIVVREFNGNKGGFHDWLVEQGYTKDEVEGVFKGTGFPPEGIKYV